MKREIVLELFDCYADMVYRIALSYLRAPQEAEDVVQTIFLKLLEGNIEIYAGKERAFLTKITINHCKNILSAARKHETVPLDETVLLARLDDQEVFDVLNRDTTFFSAAAALYVPAELLDFKFRLMKWKGYKLIEPPISARSNFLRYVEVPIGADYYA